MEQRSGQQSGSDEWPIKYFFDGVYVISGVFLMYRADYRLSARTGFYDR